MSIGPFDPTAGDYGSLNYTDPFGDTTADTGKSVAPAEPKTIMPVPQQPIAEKSTIPAKISGGNVGISPITMQGAVSIPAEPVQPVVNSTYDYFSTLGKDSERESTAAVNRAFNLLVPENWQDMSYDEIKAIQTNFIPYSGSQSPENSALIQEILGDYKPYGGIGGFGAMGLILTALNPLLATKAIEEGRIKLNKDRTGTYSVPDLRSFPHADGIYQVLNAQQPAEGGLTGAKEELNDYLLNANLGDGDVEGFGNNVLQAATGIIAKYGAFGQEFDEYVDGIKVGYQDPRAATPDRTEELLEIFNRTPSTVEGIREYSGIKDYTPSNYTGGATGKVREHHARGVTDEEYNEYYSLVQPLAQASLLNTIVDVERGGKAYVWQNYVEAIEDFYKDPLMGSLAAEFGIKPYRSTKDGSQYVLDPFTNREIRLFEAKYSLTDDIVNAGKLAFQVGVSILNPPMGAAMAASQTAVQGGNPEEVAKAAIGAYLGGQAGAGQGMFSAVGNAVAPAGSALAKGISAGAASGVATAVQGGDLDDVVKSGLLGGVGGYLQANATEAAMLQDATNAALEIGDSATALQYADEARKLTAQADLVSTIANSAKAVDAAVSGDYVSALASGMQAAGTNLTEFTSNQLTGMFGEEAFANLNIDDVAAGVNKVATSLIDGKDLDDALEEGVKEYVQQGGGLGEAGDVVKDYIKDAGGSLYENVIKPAGDMLSGLVDNVSSFDTPEGIKAIEDVVKEAGAVVDAEVLQPIKEGAESIYEPLETPDAIKSIEDVTKVAGSAIDDSLIQPVREGLKDIDVPDIDLPDVDLPKVNVSAPNVDLSGMFAALLQSLPSNNQQTPAVASTPFEIQRADLSKYMPQQRAEPAELLATRDYLSELLGTI
jgi:hypothetical protein